MCKALFAILGMAAMFVACSQTVSASSNDDENSSTESSSDSKGSDNGSSGSDGSGEVLDEDCVSESGKPWDGTTAKEFACGSGTKLSPFIILTAEQLVHLSFVVNANDKNFSGKYYKLAADIKLNDGKVIDDKGGLVGDSTKLHKWTPIGNSSIAFDGTFDGNGHTVSGMFINTTSTHNGLFGQSSGTIENLTVENSWVKGGNATAGILGILKGSASILNVVNKVSVVGTGTATGGVVAGIATVCCSKVSSINESENYGFVSGGQDVGGIIGGARDIRISDVKNDATIEGTKTIGGIAGNLGYNSNLTKAVNYGKISGKEMVAGISGYYGYMISCSTTEKNGVAEKIRNYGTIEGQNYTAGIFGKNDCTKNLGAVNEAKIIGSTYTAGLFGYVKNSITENGYNVGDVYGLNYVGGIAGYNEVGITRSLYSTGKVDGDSLVGLMIGYNYNTTMADYYYLKQGDQEPFGLNNGGGVATPKTESEMKSADFAKLLGDDFVYDSGLNDGYPVLAWEKK